MEREENLPPGFVLDYDKFTYDPGLDKYSKVNLFPEKVAKAKEAIKHPGFKKPMDSLGKDEPQ